jgi:hypothetical protein
MKNLQKKKLQNSCQLAAPKNLCRFFSVLQEKFVCFKFPCKYRKHDFSMFLLMVGLSPGTHFNDGTSKHQSFKNVAVTVFN